MKSNQFFVTTITLFVISIIFVTIPSITSVFGVSGNTTTFNVTLTITTGTPTITYVDAISNSPNEGTTKLVSFYFNATHPNGVSNIPASGANVSINQSGVTLFNNGSCIVYQTTGITNRYECNISISYYHLPGLWTINASIVDIVSNVDTDTGSMYTNGNTYGLSLRTNSISFSGTPGQTVAASTQQQVNNTGNVAYTQINLTAFDIATGANIIAASNFTANTTGTGNPGHQLANNTAVTLYASSIAIQGSRDLNLSLTIPTGSVNGTYTSVSSWIVTLS